MKNIHGAQVGDIWCLKGDYHYLLLEYREDSSGRGEDAFYAICLEGGFHDFVFFDHNAKSKNWEKVA